MSDSKKEKQKKNRARRAELIARSAIAYRRKQGLASDQEEAELASYLRRFGAFAIDQMLFFFFYMAYSVICIIFFGEQLAILIASFTAIYLFGFLYIVPRIAKSGQTFGRKKMDILVIRENGEGLLDYNSSLKRWGMEFALPSLISTFVFLLLSNSQLAIIAGMVNVAVLSIVIAPVFKSADRQGFHDKFAKSVVIKQLKQ